MRLGEPFSQSTGGYLTGIGVPVVALLVAAMWRAWAQRLHKQDLMIAKIQESATEQNKALAILLADHNHVAATVAVNSSKITALDTSLAVLASKVEEHHRWVERQHEVGNPHAV
jgi:hypothetical protein